MAVFLPMAGPFPVPVPTGHPFHRRRRPEVPSTLPAVVPGTVGVVRSLQEDGFTEISVPLGEQEAFYQRLNEQRASGRLCDVEVVVGERNFPAHRCVLAAQSDYFQSMFNEAFIEGRQREIKVQDITTDIMEQVLGFLYTGRCRVNVCSAVEVFKAADMLLLEHLKLQMIDYLFDMLSDYNALDLFNLGLLYNIAKLGLGAWSKIMKNFSSVSLTENFLHVSKDALVMFLTDWKKPLGGGNVSPHGREELAFQSVLRWVKSDSSRKEYTKELMSHIRFPLMQASYVVEVVKEEPLMAECPEFVEEAVKYHMMEGKRGGLQTSRTRPVLTDSDLVTCAVKQEGPKAHLACFVAKHKRWYELQSLCLQDGESVTCATTFGSGPSLSLLVGTSTGHVYDVEVTQMGELSTSLPGRVSCDKLLSVNGSKKVYALCTEKHPAGLIMSRVYKLSIKQYVDTARCEELPGMPLPMEKYEAVVLNKKLCVISGCVIPGQAHRTLQCFDTKTSTWSVVPLNTLPNTPNVMPTCLAITKERSVLCFPSEQRLLFYTPHSATKFTTLPNWNLPVLRFKVDDYFMVYQKGFHLLCKKPVDGKCAYSFSNSFSSRTWEWVHRPSLPWDSCTVFCGNSS